MSLTNAWAKLAVDRTLAGQTYEMFLLVANSVAWQTPATLRGLVFMAAISADEASDASYARVAVVPTTDIDAAAPGSRILIPDVTFPSLAAIVGEILGVGLVEVQTNDADSNIVGVVDVDALNVTPDGNDLIVRDGAGGLARLLTG